MKARAQSTVFALGMILVTLLANGRAFGQQSGIRRGGIEGSPGVRRSNQEAAARRASGMFPVGFQAVIYEVQVPTNQRDVLDAVKLDGQAGTVDALLKALNNTGKTRILYRFNQPVNLFSGVIQLGTQEPVVTGTQIASNGQAINQVTHSSLGATIRLTAQAPAADSNLNVPDATISVTISEFAPGGPELPPPGGPSPARGIWARRAQMKETTPLEFDRPGVMVSTNTTTRGSTANPTVYVVRYAFARKNEIAANQPGGLAPKLAPGTLSSAAAPGISSSDTNLTARFQATFYEVQASADRLNALDSKALNNLDTSVEKLLQVFGAAAKTRVLSEIDQPVNVFSDQIDLRTNQQIISSVSWSPNATQPVYGTVQTREGLFIGLSSQKPPIGANRTGPDVTTVIQFAAMTPSTVEFVPGTPAGDQRILASELTEPLQFGQPRVMVFSRSTHSEEQAVPLTYVVRFMFSPPAAKP